MTNIRNHIRQFWDDQPCGTTHLDLLPGSREYFIEFNQYYEALYPYLRPFLDLESMRGKQVVEIGLGSGCTLQWLADVAENCIGLDLSGGTAQLNQARKRHFDLDYSLTQASATQIPLPDNSVDVVVSIGCLHHIPDIQNAIAEIHRVLKVGGTFKGMLYNRDSYRFRVYIPLARRYSRRWRGKTWQDCVNEMYDGSGNPYGMVFSKDEVGALFNNKFDHLEFQVENFLGGEVLPFIGEKVPRKLWLATLGKVAGLDLYFTATAIKNE